MEFAARHFRRTFQFPNLSYPILSYPKLTEVRPNPFGGFFYFETPSAGPLGLDEPIHRSRRSATFSAISESMISAWATTWSQSGYLLGWDYLSKVLSLDYWSGAIQEFELGQVCFQHDDWRHTWQRQSPQILALRICILKSTGKQ